MQQALQEATIGNSQSDMICLIYIGSGNHRNAIQTPITYETDKFASYTREPRAAARGYR